MGIQWLLNTFIFGIIQPTYLLLGKPKYRQPGAPPVDQVEPPQLEPSEKDQFEQDQLNNKPTLNEVEPIKLHESPAIDQIRPFTLEGL